MTTLPQPAPPEPAAGELLPTTGRVCRAIWRVAIAATLAIGGSNLAVWFVPPAQKLAAAMQAMVMRANTSLGLTLAGAALLLWAEAGGSKWCRRLAQMLGLIVAAIGGVTAFEHLSGVNLAFDQLLVAGTFPGDRAGALVTVPGRMSMNAAFALFFLGLSILALDWRLPGTRTHLAQGLAILASLPAALGLVGYLLDVGNFTGLLRSTKILLHAAAALLLAAMGVLALRPERQPLRQIFAAGADGLLLRWLLPGSAALMIALAWIVGQIRLAGVLAPGEGAALMLYGGLVLLFALLFFASRAVAVQQRRARQIAEDLRRAKDAAESANQAKDKFLAALSHELRTPLTPVLLTSAALRDDVRLPPEVRADISMIARHTALEARLIDDLLDLTRVGHGKLTLRREECDVHAVLGQAVEIVRPDARRKGVRLEVAMNAASSGHDCDPARLEQLFWNVLQNAVKFTARGGAVQVSTRNEGGAWLAEVADNGAGFEPAYAERLFDPFEQAGRQNDARFGGLGLGLAIAKNIAELHGGSIRAASEGPHRGATFTIALPNSREVARTAAAEAAPEPAAPPARLSLLLVEDHPPTLAILTKMLKRAGHEVASASTVSDGLATADSVGFDALVSDIGLPDGTGLDLVRELRKRRGDFFAVALSGFGTDEDLARSKAAGFKAHLIKPVEFSQLQQVLRQCVPGAA